MAVRVMEPAAMPVKCRPQMERVSSTVAVSLPRRPKPARAKGNDAAPNPHPSTSDVATSPASHDKNPGNCNADIPV